MVERVLGAVAAAVVVGFVLVFTWVGLDRPFGNGDEVVYAQNVREMKRTGDFTNLAWQGHEVLQRPPLPFVLAAAGSALVEGEVGLRLSSALASLATLLVLWLGAVRLWRSRWAATAAVLLCATAPSYHVFSRALLSDPWFVAATTVALCAGLVARREPRALVVAGGALGLAFAFKSLAAAVPAVALAPVLWTPLRRARPRVRGCAGLAFAFTALPYYAFGLIEHGGRFWREHVGYSLWARARGELELGMSDPLAYPSYLVAADGPVVAIWLAIAVVGTAALAILRRDRTLGAAAAFPLLFVLLLSLVGTRLPHYLLPLYPAAGLCAAAVIAEGPRAQRAARGAPARITLTVIPAVLVAVAVVFAPLAGVRAGHRPRAHLLPSPQAHALGREAAAAVPDGAPVYTLEWYAPAFGYYADRDLVMLTASERWFEVVDDVDFLHAAGAVAMVPPPPVAPGQPMWIAGPEDAIAGAGWLRVERVVVRRGALALVRAEAARADGAR